MSDESLPPGWTEVLFEELLIKLSNGTTAEQQKDPPGIPVSRIETISDAKINLSKVRYVREASPELLERFLLQPGDILFSHINSDSHLGKCALYRGGSELLHGMNLLLMRTSPAACPEFIEQYLTYLRVRGYFIQIAQHAVNQSSLNQKKINQIPIPLPPLAEQKRIVAKIEELFSELEAGEESLRVARRQLGVYRQSLLKQAFEGKLTAKWRTQNPAQLESPTSLIAAAAENRRQHWNGRGKYQPARGPKLDAERPIPDCWTYASVDQVTLNFDGQRVPLKREDRDKRSGAYPYYGASGVIDDIDDFLFDGDFLLIAEDGANLLSRSTPIAFQAHGKFWVNNHAHIVQPVTAMLMRYLELFLNGRDLTRFITGTAQPKLTQANLDQVPVPLCSLPEQQEIVRLLDEQFEVIAQNEREIDAALQRSEALRQAILKKAFTGRLVPQSPADEPASQLLARLRSERTETPISKRKPARQP